MGHSVISRTAFLTIAPSILFTSACFSRVNIDVVQRSVDEFHLRVAGGQADAIYYEDATDNYRMSISREINRSRFARLRRKMGACPSSAVTAIAVSSGSRGTSATASYKTTCSNGVLNESFLWQIADGKAKLDAYDTSSPLLLGD
jgi:hypothetical protein